MNHARQTTSSTSTNGRIDAKDIEHLFLRFSAMYGHVWNSQFTSKQIQQVIKQEWLNALSRFSKASIKRGLDLCLASKELPPTLPMFIGLCQVAAPYHQEFKRVELTEEERRAEHEAGMQALARASLLSFPRRRESRDLVKPTGFPPARE